MAQQTNVDIGCHLKRGLALDSLPTGVVFDPSRAGGPSAIETMRSILEKMERMRSEDARKTARERVEELRASLPDLVLDSYIAATAIRNEYQAYVAECVADAERNYAKYNNSGPLVYAAEASLMLQAWRQVQHEMEREPVRHATTVSGLRSEMQQMFDLLFDHFLYQALANGDSSSTVYTALARYTTKAALDVVQWIRKVSMVKIERILSAFPGE